MDTHILQKVKVICKKAGIRQATVHALRHSFSAHLRMAGIRLADIADLLGHKDLATTQTHENVMQEHLRSVVGKLQRLVQSIPGRPTTTTLPPGRSAHSATAAPKAR